MDLSQLIVRNTTTGATAADAAVTFTVGNAGFVDSAGNAVSIGKVSVGMEMTGAELAKKLDGSQIEIDDITYDVTANGSKLTFTAQTKPDPTATPADGFQGSVGMVDPTTGKVNQGDQFSITPEVEAIPEEAGYMARLHFRLMEQQAA